MKIIKILTIVIAMSSTITFAQNGNSNQKRNVLLIIVDDLKPVLGCYGNTSVKTPGIDNFAESAVVFDNAYCQQAVCAPSRISTFTGLRPDRTEVWDLKTNMRDKNPDIVTVPEYFMQNGYITAGVGKIMHGAKNNDPRSWSIPYEDDDKLEYAEGFTYPANGKYQNPEIREAYNNIKKQNLGWKETNRYLKSINMAPSTECLDVPDNAYEDGAIAEKGIELLNELSADNKPFLLTLGFHKPHLPFVAPKKYWDMYERDKIPLAQFRQRADNSPAYAYHSWGELRNYSDIPQKGQLSEDKQREVIHGYWASVSYVDAQVYKVLVELKRLGLDKNTIVVIWGDHGWHLGDHGLWCKHTNFEQATRIPFIISAPGYIKGVHASTMAEAVDILPTIASFAGIDIPKTAEGDNLLPAMRNPDIQIKDYAISQFPRGKNIMGYSIRTHQYRFTMWVKGDFSNTDVFRNPQIEAVELYDYKKDPLEKVSVAKLPQYKPVADKLQTKLIKALTEQSDKAKLNR